MKTTNKVLLTLIVGIFMAVVNAQTQAGTVVAGEIVNNDQSAPYYGPEGVPCGFYPKKGLTYWTIRYATGLSFSKLKLANGGSGKNPVVVYGQKFTLPNTECADDFLSKYAEEI